MRPAQPSPVPKPRSSVVKGIVLAIAKTGFAVVAGSFFTVLVVIIATYYGFKFHSVNIQMDYVPGMILDDYKLTNKSGQTLTNVQLTLTRIGPRNTGLNTKYFWASWAPGETHTLNPGMDWPVDDVQKAVLDGSADQGAIHVRLLISKK